MQAALEWRNIGPHRGGRVVAVAGHPTRPLEFFFGSTGGGVWRTANGGITWQNVSDGFLNTASVGAIAIAPSDPNVIYVGMGETTIRGNASHGDGVYKSLDGGKTWQHLGLADSRHIGRVRVHPRDPDLVYVAALGHAFGPNRERGVFRTRDGGRTWEQVLFVSEDAGAVDLCLDPFNPRVIYASTWYARRTPWSMTSGGPGSALWRSTDGGDTWTDLSKNPGMPKEPLGKIGVAASPAREGRLWAMVEAEDGGLFRSDDAGATWTRTTADRNLRARAWYYSHVYADPQDAETVYVLNVFFWKSNDGGSSLVPISTPHPDHHDLWIDPQNPQRMISGNDGGACVSFDGGLSWSSIYNQPTGEWYHVITDTRFPYRVYGAQQDNTTLCLPSRTETAGITEREWHDVGGAESGYIAVRPDNPDIVYAGSSGGGEGGRITRYDRKTRQRQEISVWPERTAGLPAGDYKYRFQWTAPIVLSPHDPNVLYSCANIVFRSTNEGQSWKAISPDLTRNDPSKLGPSGGPITKDHTGVEVYCTVFAFAESPAKPGLLWAGSDDGLVHISRDGGASWTNVTPPDLPEWALISIIEPSAHDPAVAYLAATRYKLDDQAPYLYKTTDYGRTWARITAGLPENAFTRVIREDPEQPGLLFCGTERGVFYSRDGGASWQSLRLNLPMVPVHDLAVRAGDLVAATHGRGFWILDDISPLRQGEPAEAALYLFPPRETVRFRVNAFLMAPPNAPPGPFAVIELPMGTTLYMKGKPEGGRAPEFLDAGRNPPNGVLIHFYLKEKPEGEVKLAILDREGKEVRSFSSTEGPEAERLKVQAGGNRFVWNLLQAPEVNLPDAPYKAGPVAAPLSPPGEYRVRLTAGGQTLEQPFRVVKDPRIEATQADLEEQFRLAAAVRDCLTGIHKAVLQIRSLREQIEGWVQRAKEGDVAKQGSALAERLTALEGELVQTRWQSAQDTLNFPPRLNAKVAHLARIAGAADARPTAQMQALFDELKAEADRHLAAHRALLEDVKAFGAAVRDAGVPLVAIE